MCGPLSAISGPHARRHRAGGPHLGLLCGQRRSCFRGRRLGRHLLCKAGPHLRSKSFLHCKHHPFALRRSVQAHCFLPMRTVPVMISLLMMCMENDHAVSFMQGKTRPTRFCLASSCPVLILCRPEDHRQSTATSKYLLIRDGTGRAGLLVKDERAEAQAALRHATHLPNAHALQALGA